MVAGLPHHSMLILRPHQSDQCRTMRHPTLLVANGPMFSWFRVHFTCSFFMASWSRSHCWSLYYIKIKRYSDAQYFILFDALNDICGRERHTTKICIGMRQSIVRIHNQRCNNVDFLILTVPSTGIPDALVPTKFFLACRVAAPYRDIANREHAISLYRYQRHHSATTAPLAI
jgi:hypothetical protein